MMKVKRQSKILDLIKENAIETQDELVYLLLQSGFEVTQATISRDIRELKLTKVVGGNGRQHYAALAGRENESYDRLHRILKDSILSMDYAQNILVIKTLPGLAMAVGSALDTMGNVDIVGTVSGDNTMLCVTKSEEKAIILMEKIRLIVNEKENS